MLAPDRAEVVAHANRIMFRPREETLRVISATALEVGVTRQMTQHEQHGQPMPGRDELVFLAAQEILAARGLEYDPHYT
jgi:hypothetical protein